MKAIKINGKIKVYTKLPKNWKNFSGFENASPELLEQEGFFDVAEPTYDQELQRLGEIFFDETKKVFTYPIVNIPQKELDDRKSCKLENLDNQFDQNAAKRLLRKVAEPILTDETNLTEQDIEDVKMLYTQWCDNGVNYVIGDKVVYTDKLYKVLQNHTSQESWTPDAASSLFAKYRPLGSVEKWVQPDSTNPYMINDLVIFKGKTYESTINNNVWPPTAYPAGWKEI